MIVDIVTIFPRFFNEFLETSIIKRAIEKDSVVINIHDLREYASNKHKQIDDTPYGGGAGMVMTPDPVVSAIEAVDPDHKLKRIYLSPKGKQLKQSLVEDLAKEEQGLLLLCGDYEGIDERIIDLCIDEEISIGDYVLTGGELPALVLINAVARYVDGVLGSSESTNEESFSNGLLEYPHYTRPAVYRGLKVPEVLQSGNHGEIAKWRKEQSLRITRERRPDLLDH